MKTDNSLLEKMLSDDNLIQAYLRVYRNKGAEGIDGMKYTDLKRISKSTRRRNQGANQNKDI